MVKDRTKIFTDLFKAAVASRMEENKKRNMIDLQELLRITKFTKQEIKMMYRGFKQVRQGNYTLGKDYCHTTWGSDLNYYNSKPYFFT